VSGPAGGAQWVLHLVSAPRVGAAAPECLAAHAYPGLLSGVARSVWQSADLSGPASPPPRPCLHDENLPRMGPPEAVPRRRDR